MTFSGKYYFLVFLIGSCLTIFNISYCEAQTQNKKVQTYAVADTISIDTLSIVPNTVILKNIPSPDYLVIPEKGILVFIKKPNLDSVEVSYRIFDVNFSKKIEFKSTDLISSSMSKKYNYTSAQANANYNNSFVEQSSMDYSGSLSRAIAFGNSQDLSLNSQFNLQLNGVLADSIFLQASLTDNTIPFQPDGTTQNIQEFDKIAIEFKKRNALLALGDYEMLRPQSYFMNYYKRVQGIKFSNKMQLPNAMSYTYSLGASLAKGKYVRATLPVVEGNQGPYKIQGPNGELYFTILANTEKITIDGVLQTRGEDNDYIMDYNIGEITFMPNKMITKDSRVIVEYEFNDRNFLNSLLYTTNEWQTKNKLRFYVNVYSNQDSKNQSLIQTLSPANKIFLSGIGDNYQKAFFSSARADTFNADRIMYALMDTIVNGVLFDSIYSYSTNADSAKYLVSFSFVGVGKGNYLQSVNIANGRIYQWQAPINGMPQGSFEPYILLITPKRQQMVSAGVAVPLGKKGTVNYELAMSNNDPNLFSSLGEKHLGLAHKFGFLQTYGLGKKKLTAFTTSANYELVEARFRPLENYRTAEFTRDWNVAFTPIPLKESIANVELKFAKAKSYEINSGFSKFQRGAIYNGLRYYAGATIALQKWNLRTLNSLTKSEDTSIKAVFFRPDVEVFRTFKKLGEATIGAKYIAENNMQYSVKNDSLTPFSYAFDVKTIYWNNGNAKENKYAITYFTREDKLVKNAILVSANKSENLAFNTEINTLKNHKINGNITYRKLKILDSILTRNTGEDNLLGRLGYDGRFFKNAITYNLLYEFGSGQELKREFAYLQVATGQGLYTWRDYNNDKVKQLNEFEIAVFNNEKNYIRVFTPSNTYLKAKYNIFNQTINITPALFFAKNNKSNFKNFISRFVIQSQLQTNAKYIAVDALTAYLPFYESKTDTNLLSKAQSVNTNIFFNRQSQKWSANYQNIYNASNILLTYGVDARVQKENVLQARYNITKKIMIQSTIRKGLKFFESPFLSTRNYAISYIAIEPNINYLSKNNNYSSSIGFKFENKNNQAALGGEIAKVRTFFAENKYIISGASNFKSRLSYSSIQFNGLPNTTLSYVILDGLNKGNNFIFTVGIDKKVSKGLELNVSYEGRKSDLIPTIHTGNISARALF